MVLIVEIFAFESIRIMFRKNSYGRVSARNRLKNYGSLDKAISCSDVSFKRWVCYITNFLVKLKDFWNVFENKYWLEFNQVMGYKQTETG